MSTKEKRTKRVKLIDSISYLTAIQSTTVTLKPEEFSNLLSQAWPSEFQKLTKKDFLDIYHIRTDEGYRRCFILADMLTLEFINLSPSLTMKELRRMHEELKELIIARIPDFDPDLQVLQAKICYYYALDLSQGPDFVVKELDQLDGLVKATYPEDYEFARKCWFDEHFNSDLVSILKSKFL